MTLFEQTIAMVKKHDSKLLSEITIKLNAVELDNLIHLLNSYTSELWQNELLAKDLANKLMKQLTN